MEIDITQEFNKLVELAIKDLPKEFREKLSNVDVFVEDYPTPEQLYKLRMRKGHTLLGLYEGIPQTKRGSGYGIGGTMPDKITLFREAIMSVSQTESELVEQIRETLFHEIGHHFGMSEEELRRAQAK